MPSRILIRTIKFKNYSETLGRFRHQEIFEPYGDGISVFLEECALEKSTICAHITKFYPNTVDNPVFYWKIDEQELLNHNNLHNSKIEQSESAPNAQGDKDGCHHDISVDDIKNQDFRDGRRSFAKDFCKPPNLYICVDGESHQLTEDELKELTKWVKEKKLVQDAPDHLLPN